MTPVLKNPYLQISVQLVSYFKSSSTNWDFKKDT